MTQHPLHSAKPIGERTHINNAEAGMASCEATVDTLLLSEVVNALNAHETWEAERRERTEQASLAARQRFD